MPEPRFLVREVVRPINRGGFGRVDEVIMENGERLARKTFSPHPSIAHDPDICEKARKRFVREVAVQAQIDHPHVIPILHSELQSDPPWFLMPLAGRSLEDQIQDDRRDNMVRLEPLTQMLAGLEELHRLGFVHRDLKPLNVLHVGGRWMLSDLGLVLPPSGTTTALTGPHSAWGSRPYAAPEVMVSFHTVTAAADIFSVGCILHDYVAGTARVPHAQCTHPGQLGGAIEKCTAPRPRDRFPDVSALRNALVMVLGAHSSAAPAGPQVAEWLANLKDAPGDLDEDSWADIARFVDVQNASSDAGLLLYAIDGPQIVACADCTESAFLRLAAVITRWVKEGSFGFEFCDVLGARLARIFERGGTREKSDAVMAALHLGFSHNRWTVMRLFFRLASASLPSDVADRLSIELLALGWTAELMIERLETAIGASRGSLHPLIQAALAQLEPPESPAF